MQVEKITTGITLPEIILQTLQGEETDLCRTLLRLQDISSVYAQLV